MNGSFDPLIRDTLDEQVPLRTDRRGDWNDVLERSHRSHRWRRRTLALVAVAAALAVAASALAAIGEDPLGSLGDWLNGSPGTPASSAQQASFASLNAASYAKFPAGTKIRRLDQASIAGKSFVLLGFKSGESLCLQLEPVRVQCVTIRELDTSAAPALVATEEYLSVGARSSPVDGIIGFADDTVKAVQFRSGHGAWQTAPVENNVFVGLAGEKRTGPRLIGGPMPEIDEVRAVTTSGAKVAVPFVAGFAAFPNGVPTVPSYIRFGAPKPSQLPGPDRPTVRFAGGTISWLVHHEPRGSKWQPTRPRRSIPAAARFLKAGSILYSRAVEPDPRNPFRIGIFLRRSAGALPTRSAKRDTILLCTSDIRPLSENRGWQCSLAADTRLLFPAGAPFKLDGNQAGEVTSLTGLAADQVASMNLFLGSGRVVPVSLTDNAFSVGAPATQFPAKLVAYDKRGQVLGLQVIPGPPHPIPCPAPSIWPASKLPPTRSYQTLNLANLTVGDRHILGMTPAEVTNALGTPQRTTGFEHPGSEKAYFYGGILPGGTLLHIRFQANKNGTKAVELDFQGRGLTDAKLGHLLNTTPLTLQHELTATDRFRLASAYGSAPDAFAARVGGGCSGVVTAASNTVISFGVNTYQNARPFLEIIKQ